MDQNAIRRYAKLIVSISKGLSEVDPAAKSICTDIVGKARTNNRQSGIKKIAAVMAQCKISSTNYENENIFEEIQQLI